MRALTLLAGLLLVTCISLLISLLSGSVAISWQDLLTIIAGQGDPLQSQVILDLRWPRSITAFTTGALLSLAGALMQVLLRNPLADPYVLGVSGGAGCQREVGLE